MNNRPIVLSGPSAGSRYVRFLLVSAILLIATLLFLYCFEFASLAIRLVWEEDLLQRRRIATVAMAKAELLDTFDGYGYKVDRRSAREVVDTAAAAGHPLVPFVWPVYVYEASHREIFPLSGVANQDVLLDNENGFWPIVHHDNHGFNNDQQAWNSPDFVFMGQSTIYGSGVNRHQHFIQLIRKYDNLKILNLGYPQIPMPDGYLALIREYFSVIHPKYVIWEILGRNVGREGEHDFLHKAIFRQYDDPRFSQGLLERQREIDSATRLAAFHPLRHRQLQYSFSGSVIKDILLLRNLRSQSVIINTLTSPITAPPITYRTEPQRSSTPAQECNPARVTREIKFLRRASQEIAPTTEIIVLMMPSREGLRGDYDSDDYCHDSYLAAVSSAGYRTIDLPSIIKDRSIPVEKLYEMAIPSTIHFSVTGQEIAAKLIATELQRLTGQRKISKPSP